MIKLVIFDLAGTTVKDEDVVCKCLLDAMAFGGVTGTRDLVNKYMGTPKRKAMRELLPDATEDEVDAAHEEFRRLVLDYYHNDPGVAEMPGASAVFAALREKGVRVATDTGFDRETCNAIFDRLGWHDKLDASVTADEVPRGRPFPDMVFHLMERLGVSDAGAVAKVGDTPSDLQEGTSAGCGLVIGLTWGTHTREELEVHPHTHLLGSVQDVLGAVEAFDLVDSRQM